MTRTSPGAGPLRAIVPAGASVAEARGDVSDATLFASEEAEMARAVASRRREFATGRACAHAALEQLGLSRQAIPRGQRGAPRWPRGIVGSITHCDGYRAAVVAHNRDFAALGVDAEPNAPLPKQEILREIALPEEEAQLATLTDASPSVSWDRLLFSAKESVFKVWFPLTERWLGFADASISIDPLAGTFAASLPARMTAGVERNLKGRWLVSEQLVLTAIAVPT